MNTTHNTGSAPETAADTDRAPERPTEDRGLLVDLMAATPAHTMSRELLCAVISLAIAGVVLFVIAPPLHIVGFVIGLVIVVMGARFVWGALRHGWFSADR
ncbi:hypothetical protein [Brachybacterium timonense]|uniref:hypothetical protein n=1 Tax=Brachybacterium timonense TaxID=2050896 RepID=UPI000D0B929F|nr:hypothetical protein [Brachybacterium timonense]